MSQTPIIGKGEIYVPPQSITLRKVGTEKGGGNYHSTDGRFYIVRNEDKLWVWGYNHYADNQGNYVSATNGDDLQYSTKSLCVAEIERLIREEKLEALLWEN